MGQAYFIVVADQDCRIIATGCSMSQGGQPIVGSNGNQVFECTKALRDSINSSGTDVSWHMRQDRVADIGENVQHREYLNYIDKMMSDARALGF